MPVPLELRRQDGKHKAAQPAQEKARATVRLQRTEPKALLFSRFFNYMHTLTSTSEC